MLAAVIFLSWIFIVVLACLVGTNKEFSVSQSEANKLKTTCTRLYEKVDDYQRKGAFLLSYFHESYEKEYRSFDDVLNNLPVVNSGDYGYPRQYELMQQDRFDAVAFHALAESDVPDRIMATKLAFNAQPIWWGGREIVGWERNGWVLLHKETLDAP